jgi:uracil-DNA glycosylase
MIVNLHHSWKSQLASEFEQPYFQTLLEFVKEEYQSEMCFPPAELIFAAFDHCHFDNLKVVILGQDPYHGPGQANGLCFSVSNGIPMPPSLRNIFKEIHADLGLFAPDNGNLIRWADQGVLLLNTTLTVRAHLPGSHQKKGWEVFTDATIRHISEKKERVVFMLWGNYARKKAAMISAGKHLILESAHPSPLSAYQGFFGCNHFSKTNEYLKANQMQTIDW